MNRETAAVRMGERWAERGAATMRTPAADWPLRWPHGSENARSLVEPMIDDDTPDRGHLVARLTEICLDSARRRFREVRVRRV